MAKIINFVVVHAACSRLAAARWQEGENYFENKNGLAKQKGDQWWYIARGVVGDETASEGLSETRSIGPKDLRLFWILMTVSSLICCRFCVIKIYNVITDLNSYILYPDQSVKHTSVYTTLPACFYGGRRGASDFQRREALRKRRRGVGGGGGGGEDLVWISMHPLLSLTSGC